MTISVMIRSVRELLSAPARRNQTVEIAALAAITSILWSGPLQAQSSAELGELQAQLKALQSKVAALEASQKSIASSGDAGLNQALREKLEKTPVITFDNRGLRLASPERTERRVVTDARGRSTEEVVTLEEAEAYKFHLGALLQPQGRFFIDTPYDNSTALMRRARLIVDGTVYRYFDFLFQTDLLSSGLYVNNTPPGNNVTVQDAWVNGKAAEWAQLRVGKMKSPIGVERWQSANARWFTDMITTTYIAPNRSIGAMLHGKVYGGVAEYFASLVNGEPNGGSSDLQGANQNAAELQGRLALTPFARTEIDPLKQLTVGAGVTYTPQLNGLGRYGTANQQQFFTYSGNTINSTLASPGEQVRFLPNLTYFWGPFGAYAEAAWSTTGVSSGNNSANLNDFAWQAAVSYMLTGEDSSFRAIRPKRAFDPSSGQWGAVQIAARAGQLKVDGDTFPIYADPNTQAEQTTTVGVAVNWILNDNLKFTLGYDWTDFVGGAPNGGNAPVNNVVTTQLQLSF
jgi:phosphate-selective porin OprO/OprP